MLKRLIAFAALLIALMAVLPAAAQVTAAAVSAPFVRPDVKAYLDALKARPRPPMNAQTISFIRKIPPGQIAAMLSAAEMPVGTLAIDRKLSMSASGGEIGLRLFDSRKRRAPGPVLVFYHGGGFVVGSSTTHAPLAAEMARQLDMPVVSVDYRLAPEHKWPAAHEDAEAAARWVAANGKALGRKITGLLLSGDSAGGTLTLTTALALRDTPAAAPVKLIIPLYPMADASQLYPSRAAFGNGYGLDTDSMDYFESALMANKNSPRYSALLADLAGLPPTVLATASLDPLRDGGRAFAQKLILAGVPLGFYEAAGSIHGFATFRAAIPSARDDLAKILAMARAMLAP
jgi:acetyl esterase